MKKVVLLFIIIGLSGCSTSKNRSEHPDSIDPPRPILNLKVNYASCKAVLNDFETTDFFLQVDSKLFYLIQSELVYKSDFDLIIPIETESIDLGPCIIKVIEGLLTEIIVKPQSPIYNCGGMFQPVCPKPTPYICGPNGQLCY